MAMKEFQVFLESSTIHGLAYIATGRKYVRLFWIVVVIVGFTGSGALIYKSFQSWADSPVKTTIETLPITEITFPKVSVCPPKNTYTDLNYDLMMTENMTLDRDTRQELKTYAAKLLYDHLYEDIMTNLSKLEDAGRYYNWYHGYTQMIPSGTGSYNSLPNYEVYTGATSGTISTKHFGEKFNASKVEKDLHYYVRIYPVGEYYYEYTLNFEIKKISMTGLSTGKDSFEMDSGKVSTSINERNKSYTPPSGDH